MTALLQALRRYHHTGDATTGYTFQQPDEGYNGTVYRVTTPDERTVAVKLARRDARRRAWREYTVTDALHRADSGEVCPQPLSLHTGLADFSGDVVVSKWLEATPLNTPPSADDRSTWQAILQTLSRIHSLTPENTTAPIPSAAVDVQHPADMLAILRGRLSRLPEGQSGMLTHAQVSALVDAVHTQVPHHWQTVPPRGLIHCDSHPANMLHTADGRIVFVDWENAGWSDPAFDIANLTSQWRYFDLPDAHHAWLHATYAAMTDDPTLPQRVQVYGLIQTVQWVVMYSRYIRAHDTRSEPRPNAAHQHTLDFQRMYQRRYWERACRLLGVAP